MTNPYQSPTLDAKSAERAAIDGNVWQAMARGLFVGGMSGATIGVAETSLLALLWVALGAANAPENLLPLLIPALSMWLTLIIAAGVLGAAAGMLLGPLFGWLVWRCRLGHAPLAAALLGAVASSAAVAAAARHYGTDLPSERMEWSVIVIWALAAAIWGLLTGRRAARVLQQPRS